MAFWNAPLDDPGSRAAMPARRRSRSCAVSMFSTPSAARKRERAGEHVADMQIGVGISTGESVVGNMGSDIRFDYSVLGDSVNLASRLEGLTARYGVRILLCPETARLCGKPVRHGRSRQRARERQAGRGDDPYAGGWPRTLGGKTISGPFAAPSTKCANTTIAATGNRRAFGTRQTARRNNENIRNW